MNSPGKILLTLFAMILVVNAHDAWAAVISVTDNSDSGPNTLRAAIATANATVEQDTINIAVANSITVSSYLRVTKPIILNGNGTTVGAAAQSIVIFVLENGNSAINHLALINSACALQVSGSNNTITGCAIGTDWAGTTYCGNATGIEIFSTDNQIGGPSVAERNIISGNNIGIRASGTKRLLIQGNYIGTDPTGLLAIPNKYYGITLFSGSQQALIGGNAAAGQRNVISGNSGDGIFIQDASSFGNSICGNIIGLTADQSAPLSNNRGIVIDGAPGNYIGLPVANWGNVISGNNNYGIYINGNVDRTGSNNFIRNNIIGLNSTGTRMANDEGVYLSYSNANTIGGVMGSGRYDCNVISGNARNGIFLIGNNNIVSGNYIGTNATGVAAIGNSLSGIHFAGFGNLLGGLNLGGLGKMGNIISGQNQPGLGYGIYQMSGSDVGGNTISGNTIGLNANGTSALPNAQGIFLSGASTLVGGTSSIYRNIISGNTGPGIRVAGSTHTISGNYIGLSAAGNLSLPNGDPQIDIFSSGNMIGGATFGEKNLIGSNGITPISLDGTNAFGNTIMGNAINVLADGSPAAPSSTYGILLDNGAQGNYLGLKNGQGNLIVATRYGISVFNPTTISNAIFSNTICAFANTITGFGIWLAGNGNNNYPAPTIASSAANFIAGQAQAGDYIEVFRADRDAGYQGGSLTYLGATTAIAAGSWNLVPIAALSAGEYICATATDPNNNTSKFSANVLVTAPLATPTLTITPTATVTPTPTIQAFPWGDKSALVYPNPGQDTIHFAVKLHQPGNVRIEIYNFNAERVQTLTGALAPDNPILTWDCRHVAPGIFIARILVAGKETAKIKVAVLH